jgi:branched-chain amino acid transport system permease protein
VATIAPAVRQAFRESRVLQARVIIPVAIVAFLAITVVEADYRYSYLTRLGIAGLGNGVAAALSGLGLVLTYRTTGVFNFAQGAIATFVAYIYWTLAVSHGVPISISALIAIGLVGPGIGLIIAWFPFGFLERRQATTTEKLVVTLGLTVLLIGVTTAIWGAGSKSAPSFLPYADRPPWRPFGDKYPIGYNVIGDVVLLAAIAIGLTLLFRFTRLGTEIRAVVDRRQLAELSAVNAVRVSAIAWALSCGFAAIVGVIYANTVTLDPYRTTLLVLNTFVVAVVARLKNLPTALASGIVLGVLQAMFEAYSGHEFIRTKVGPNLLSIALVVFLIAYQKLDEVGSAAATARSIVTGKLGRARRMTPGRLLWSVGIVAAIVAVPWLVSGESMKSAQEIVALTVAFLSIVAITGFSGNISLGQAGFAGAGAFLTAKFSTVGLFFVPSMPVIPAMLLAAALMVPVGIITGYPSLRRKGLILGLSTLAMGVIIDAFVFNNDRYYRGFGEIHRPSLFGLDLTGDKAWFFFELVVLAVMLFLVRNLRSGRLGRILAAMRDSDQGALATGISLRKYKLFIFAASAFVASIGGSLFMLTQVSFGEQPFSPLYSLFWFTAVVVAGLSYLSGAAIAAILFVGLDQVFNRQGVSLFIIGAIALFMPFMPGGIVGTFARLVSGGLIPRGLMQRYLAAKETKLEAPAASAQPSTPEVVPTPLARDLITGRRP